MALLILSLSIGVPLNAQSIDPCFGLAVEDCSVISNASTNTLTSVTTFKAAFQGEASLTGLEALGMGTDFAFNFSGTGSFSRESVNPDFPFALELLLDTSPDGDTTHTNQIHLKIVHGSLYVEDIASHTWRGIAAKEVLNSPQFAGLKLIGSPLAGLNLPAPSSDSAGLDSLSSLINVPGFITYERLDDDASTEEALSPFSFQLDFVPLFQSGEFQQTLAEGLKIAGQISPDVQNLAFIAPLLLQNSDLKVKLTQFVNVTDNFVHRLTLDITGSMDLNPLMGTSGDTSLDPVSLSVYFEITLNDLNQSLTITVPADFQPLPLEELRIK
ncbi:MAG TPA: hypothetical protein VHL11_04460 [Phototrophicaceae bacterium]|nr:hypothetical protein [Phototrophicaceae bacterium]